MVRDCTLAGGRAQNRRGHRQMHIAKHALVFAGGFLPVPYLLLLHPGVHGVRPTLVGAAVWYLVVAVSVDVWVVQRRGRSAR